MYVWQGQDPNLRNNLSTTNVGKWRTRCGWRRFGTFGWTKNKFGANDGHLFFPKQIFPQNRTCCTYCTAHTFCTLFYRGYDWYVDQDIKSCQKLTWRTHLHFVGYVCFKRTRRTKRGCSMLPTGYIYIPGHKTEYIFSYVHN